eukprot:2828159-Amphidinium_carterae.1
MAPNERPNLKRLMRTSRETNVLDLSWLLLVFFLAQMLAREKKSHFQDNLCIEALSRRPRNLVDLSKGRESGKALSKSQYKGTNYVHQVLGRAYSPNKNACIT